MSSTKRSLRLVGPVAILLLFAVGAVAGKDAPPAAADFGLERAVEVSGHDTLPARAGEDEPETELPDEEVVEPDTEQPAPEQLDPTACDSFATHGECVSDAARNICEPGPGHGACVREYAHLNHGQTKDDEVATDADATTAGGKPEKAARAEKAAKPNKAGKH
jgi:hypothetical protein